MDQGPSLSHRQPDRKISVFYDSPTTTGIFLYQNNRHSSFVLWQKNINTNPVVMNREALHKDGGVWDKISAINIQKKAPS